MTTKSKTKKQLTAQEAAASRGVTSRRIQLLAQADRIPGATKHGREWMIPAGFRVLPAPQRPKRMAKL